MKKKNPQNYNTNALYKKIQHMGKISKTSKQTVSIYIHPAPEERKGVVLAVRNIKTT